MLLVIGSVLFEFGDLGMSVALMHMAVGRTVDDQAEDFRTAVVPTAIHLAFALVDFPKVQIGDHFAFTFGQLQLATR